jgi:hypothetical protein
MFIPVMAAWTYALMNCFLLAAKKAFKPEALSNMVGRGGRLVVSVGRLVVLVVSGLEASALVVGEGSSICS